MESRRNGPQLSSRHDDDDDEPAMAPLGTVKCTQFCFTKTLQLMGDYNTPGSVAYLGGIVQGPLWRDDTDICGLLRFQISEKNWQICHFY